MSTYGLLLSLHVVVAILGVGQLAGLAVLAGLKGEPASLGALLRNTRLAFIVMFLSGAALDFTSGGAWHEQWWFRGSALLLLLNALLMWRAQRAAATQRVQVVQRLAWAMCASVGFITALMELKPG